MTDKDHDDDNYELPPGIVLPEDNFPSYPNWKRGIISGVVGGFLGAFSFTLLLVSRTISTKMGYAMPILGFVIFFLMVGSIGAFRPPKI